jgi:hypothetical protein
VAAPETLTVKTHRERANWWQSSWVRRTLLLVPIALVVLALLNVFGQHMTTTKSAAPAATLIVSAPTHARSGLVYAARFRVDAIRDLKNATLVLDPGWADGFTVNGEAPQPLTQGSANGRLNFGFGHIPAGSHLTFWLSLQVNPTTVGHHTEWVRLFDGTQLIAVMHRDLFVFP